MGGSVNDQEAFYLITGIRQFALSNNYNIRPILLSLLIRSDDYSDSIKSSICVDSISKVITLYKLLPSFVFLRNKTSSDLSAVEVSEAVNSIHRKTLISADRIVFIPEVSVLEDLYCYLGSRLV
jgi:hypothetical protein